jgi:VCBS repeat-containing protein
VTDVFTYTITDGDGDTASANVTVTINGVEDAAPTITVADLNGADAGQQSVTEASGGSVNGTVTINADAGVKTLTIGGQDVTDATNNTVTITGSDGNLQVTTFNPATGILSYTYTEDGAADDHSTAAVNDQFSIEVSDNEDDSASDTLSITIDDTQPTAVADTNSVTEDATDTTATGNLLSNDSQGADTPLVINGLAAGNSQQNTGMYGDLTINADGNYSYVLSNGDASVQALRSGQQLVDTFSYSVTDTDGDTSSSSLIVTILGVDEPPAISIADNNGASAGDESVAENATTTNLSFVINAEAGLASSGTALQITDEQSDVLSLTSLQLQSLATSNQTLIGVDGTLVLNGYSNTSDDFTIKCSFDPTGTNRDHSGGDQSVVEMFSIVATDDFNRSTQAALLDILITDTAPTAAQDNASVTEGGIPNVAVGDVTTNDTSGADTAISVVGIDFNGAQTVGTPFSSDYGTLDLNSDGTYTYTLDNGNNTVQELDSGESLTESFSYTITDTDGDESTTSLTVTINGADEPPSIVIPDVNGAGALGDLSVREDQTVSGTFTVNSASGLNAFGTALSITTDGSTSNLTLAQLQGLGATPVTINDANDGDFTLTGYSSAGDHHIIAYTFDPTGTSRDHSGGDNSVFESFSITATDTQSRFGADVLDILITDTNPVANNDARSVTEGGGAIAGNAVGISGAATGDVADTLIDANTTPVSDVDFGATDGTPGANIVGDFGTFVISNQGVYTYTLDNALPEVQDLNAGESLTDVFTYTITDGDGDTASANVTVTINGIDNSVTKLNVFEQKDKSAVFGNVFEIASRLNKNSNNS